MESRRQLDVATSVMEVKEMTFGDARIVKISIMSPEFKDRFA